MCKVLSGNPENSRRRHEYEGIVKLEVGLWSILLLFYSCLNTRLWTV